jgi:hypothetical protein
MGLAMLFPEVEKGGRGKKSAALNSADTAGFSSRRLEQAREVLHHSRSLAEAVVKGITPLDTATAAAQGVRSELESGFGEKIGQGVGEWSHADNAGEAAST